MLKRATLRGDERGAALVEFALVATPFFLLLVAIFESAIAAFLSQQLDHATMVAARQIRVAGQPIRSLQQLRDDIVCPALGGLLDCAVIKITVDDNPASMLDSTPANRWCPGRAGSVVSLRLTAEIPALSPWIPPAGTETRSGGLLISSSTMFRRELVSNAGDVSGDSC